MNISIRKKEADRIERENLKLLKRVVDARPTLSMKKWQKHADRAQSLKQQMSLVGRDDKVVQLALTIKDEIDRNAKPKIFHLTPIKRLNQNSEPEIFDFAKEVNLILPVFGKIFKKAELNTFK